MAKKIRGTVYGDIPEHWNISFLADLCVRPNGIQTGPFGSQLHQRDYQVAGTPIITVEHLGVNRILHQDLPRVSDEDRERLSRYAMRRGDIIFSRVGSVDRRALVHQQEDGWLFSGRCLRVRPDTEKIDPEYLSWFFGLPVFQEHMRQIAVGATMPSLNTNILSRVAVIVPSPSEQRAIAHILGTLNDKIELNRKMNETLEAIARALFKSWFVDFDPVRAKAEGRQPDGMDAATAALFPDAFEDSELGRIPRGWRVGNLGMVANNPRRGILPEDVSPATPYIGLEHMPRKSIALTEWGTAEDVTSNKTQYKQGEILFGKLRPYFHKVGIAPVDGVCSTDILVANPITPAWFSFVLMHLSSEDLIDYTDRLSNGAKMPRTSWDDMARYDVVLPPENVAHKFNEIIFPMTETIIRNVTQSRTLAALRDGLLPRLMRGEVRVKY